MRAHGRAPEGLFDEPMLMYRSQGQILGEERDGDFVVVWQASGAQGDIEDLVQRLTEEIISRLP